MSDRAKLDKIRRECELALDPSAPTLEYANGNEFYEDVLALLAERDAARQALREIAESLPPETPPYDANYWSKLVVEYRGIARAALASAGTPVAQSPDGDMRGGRQR